jgi:hypothetical protein
VSATTPVGHHEDQSGRHRGDDGGRRRLLRDGRPFGYESEHYDISMKIGSHRLSPCIEAADGDRAGDNPR